MPAEAQTRREVRVGVRERLLVVAKPGVDRQIVRDAEAVLHEQHRHPLFQRVADVAERQRLTVLLYVGERQLIEGLRGRVEERERTENRRAWLAAGAARGVMDHARAESKIVAPARPRQGVGKWPLGAVG